MSRQQRKLRWGMIGCGQIALDKALPALLLVGRAELVAIADPLEARREMAKGVIGDSPVAEFENFRDLLDDPDVDAVYIALPTGMHEGAVVAAAHSGKAILCEKPLGQSPKQCAQMLRAAQSGGVALMTGYMSRFGETFQAAKTLLADGAIGRVTFVYSNFSYPALGPYPPGSPGGWRWTDRNGGGPLLDIGVYLAFGLREILNDRVAKVGAVSARTIAPPEANVDDTTAAWFVTESGVPGTFAATFSHAESRMIFYGTDGTLELSRCFSQRPTGNLVCRGKVERELVTGENDSLPHFENYRREFAHFTDALLDGTAYAPTPFDALTDALFLEALRRGGTQAIPTAQDYLSQGTRS